MKFKEKKIKDECYMCRNRARFVLVVVDETQDHVFIWQVCAKHRESLASRYEKEKEMIHEQSIQADNQ